MTDAELIWKLIGALAVLLAMAVSVKKIFFAGKIPQPLEIKHHEEYMTRRECSVSHVNFDFRLTAVERRLDIHLSDVKREIGDLHEKVNEGQASSANRHGEVMRAIGRLEGS